RAGSGNLNSGDKWNFSHKLSVFRQAKLLRFSRSNLYYHRVRCQMAI
ncbi:hypothetical protein GGE46_006230, partial [Rhizobium etli]|nr:hypothetical protein [Rhizobium etli]MBB4539431.1 hypothetical protein [Rhizobium etli]